MPLQVPAHGLVGPTCVRPLWQAKRKLALLSPGVVVSGGQVRRSVLSPAVRVEQGAVVEGSVLMNGVKIGAGAVVRNAILDKSVIVPPDAELGVDQELDAKRGFIIDDGLTVLGKGQKFPDD